MKEAVALLKTQYEYVKQSRHVLLAYCSDISQTDFTRENSSFGRGSIRNLLVHTANTYQFWLGQCGLKRNMVFTTFESVPSIEEAIVLFEDVDRLVHEFLDGTAQTAPTEIDYEIAGKAGKTDALKIFTHVMTHEFHHKGQILSLSRHLGYIPVDTDIMR